MPMKKFLFLSALVVMGFACIGCNDGTNNDTPIESTTPATDNTDGAGIGTNDSLDNNNAVSGTTDGALNDTSNSDDAANGVVTDNNGIINDGDTTK